MADANPATVGGPGQDAAVVSYPPRLANGGQYYNYNYKDTVDVQWYSYAQNSSQTTMQIWYWTPSLGRIVNGQTQGSWQPLHKYVISQNGSQNFGLGDVQDRSGGWYLGQWNLNFTREDGQPATGITLSQPFNCTFDDSKAATTWQANAAGPTSTTSSASSSAASATTTMASTSATTTAASTSATATAAPTSGILSAGTSSDNVAPVASSSALSGGAIAGIVIAIVAALALGAALAFLILRRKKQGVQEDVPPPPTYNNGYYPGNDHYKPPMSSYSAPAPGMAGAGPGHYTPQYEQKRRPEQTFASELSGGGPRSPVIRQELPAERYS